METKYMCPIHSLEITIDLPCPDCAADYTHLPDPDKMTSDQRALEMEVIARNVDIIMESKTSPIPAEAYLNRIARLVGRPLFDVELRRTNFSNLIIEARLRSPGQRKINMKDIREVVELFPEGTNNIIFQIDRDLFDPEDEDQ